MAEYTINTTHCSVFGLDVHARSVTVRGIDRKTGEEKTRRFVDCPQASVIAEWMKEHFQGPYYAGYESGCTGFVLCRELRELGIDCDVIAISSLARSTDDRERKNDRKDAKRLLSELLNPMPSYTTVWVPSPSVEAARDLARRRADAVDATKRSKQQTSSLLLRHGYVWNEKTAKGTRKKTWGQAFWSWIEHIKLDEPASQEALRYCLDEVKSNSERIASLDAQIATYVALPSFKPYADALMLLKGIDTTTAFLLVAEIGDFARFGRGRSASKWLGTVPKENSSGERERHGRITKSGNSHCRRALIEAVSTIARHTTTPKRQKSGHEVALEVASACNRANKRLKARYTHLTATAKKNPNKAKVAVANEMIRWVCYIGQMVDTYPAQGAVALR